VFSDSGGGPAIPSAADRIRELEESLQARDDFLAIAAHELRSPLNALALRLTVLERMAQKQPDRVFADELQRARRSAERYVRRAVLLLDISRLHGAGLEPARIPLRLRDLVTDVLGEYREEAQFQGATLHAEFADEIEGNWDPHMAEEILANLVSNGIKYGRGTPVRVRCSLSGSQACIEVSDEGPGIPPGDQERIFGKFERLVGEARYRSGYGLGLWIVGQMVAAHGGSIAVDSQPGEGSTFRVLLPLDGETGQ
jgi:signal transduction histidine kinase